MANGMDAAIQGKKIDIRIQCVQEVVSKVLLSLFIKFKPIFEIKFRLVEDLDFHDTRFRISFLAASQSVNC